jgi:site-specific recombinase XerD
VPDQPIWVAQLPEAIRKLEVLPFPWVDRATLESVLDFRDRAILALLVAGGLRRDELVHLEVRQHPRSQMTATVANFTTLWSFLRRTPPSSLRVRAINW